MEIVIDERIELITVVQTICNIYEAEQKFVRDNSYKKLMEYVINLI